MDKNMLTTKEVVFVSDLLNYEILALKKSRLFARTLTDKNLAEKLLEVAKNHEERVNALLESL